MVRDGPGLGRMGARGGGGNSLFKVAATKKKKKRFSCDLPEVGASVLTAFIRFEIVDVVYTSSVGCST